MAGEFNRLVQQMQAHRAALRARHGHRIACEVLASDHILWYCPACGVVGTHGNIPIYHAVSLAELLTGHCPSNARLV